MRQLLVLTKCLLLCAAVVALAAGCAGTKSPGAAAGPTVNLTNYRHIYLLPTMNDYMGLGPVVRQRLEKCGFEVQPITTNEPPVGAQGTGMILDPQGDILTCAHVVGTRLAATVWIQGVRYVGRVAAVDTNLDAAVIVLGDNHAPFRPLPFAASSEYRMGQDVFTMGFPLAEVLGKSPRLTKGLISATVGMGDNPMHVQVSAEVQPGNSGGPLLNERGEVVGMIAATLVQASAQARARGMIPQNVNFAIKSGPIRKFLAANGIHLPAAAGTAAPGGMDGAKDSIALIRGGLVQESDLAHSPLICRFKYGYSTGRYSRVSLITVEFLELKGGKKVFELTGRADAAARTTDALLDRTFARVAAAFFPGQPDPFR